MICLLALPGNEALAASLAQACAARLGRIEWAHFPDGESRVRILADPIGEEVAIVCTLDRPDTKILPLIFAAATARELGARRVHLIAPYLAYMRQDGGFRPGEAVAARHFARLVSDAFDSLLTVDPHLHRYARLDQIYACATQVVHSAPLLAEWIRRNVEKPLVVGPDAESEQWVAEIARLAGAPHLLCRKERRGDREVSLVTPPLRPWRGRQPVLVDDIISSGATLVEAAGRLRSGGLDRPYCLAVHAVFAAGAAASLSRASKAILTTNSIAHPSNQFDLAPLIGRAMPRTADPA